MKALSLVLTVMLSILSQLGCSRAVFTENGPFGQRPVVQYHRYTCDDAAAHPSDVNRTAAGIESDADIIPAVAIPACEQAVKANPSEPRFHFQLGRAFLAAHKFKEANSEFEKAAATGYPPALFYLGQAALDYYRTSHDPEDAQTAREYFDASAADFEPASQLLSGFELNLEGFEAPNIILDLYQHRFDRLNDARIIVAEYAVGMQDFLTTAYNPTNNYCPSTLARRRIEFDLEAAVAGDAETGPERMLYNGGGWLANKLGPLLDPVWQGDMERYRKYVRNMGARDAEHLAETAGCSSVVAERIYDGVIEFSKAHRPLRQYVNLVLAGSYKEVLSDKVPEVPSEPGKTTETNQGASKR